MIELKRPLGCNVYNKLLEVWGSSVRATHSFLSDEHFSYFMQEIPSYFPQVDLTGAFIDGELVGFSGIAEGRLDMLFVADEARHQGVGSALLRDGLARNHALTVEVNEQNPAAVGFYESHGFVAKRRDEVDGFGFPYPVLHMELQESD
ncbi:GNAT family N-acetyltransferase [Timonella sp. A28]|uniref:GNAT family N-acetyltransferase n=1 Tax=Timonella sp. A28 TaxID=3442640 RepID=UPI003EBE9824